MAEAKSKQNSRAVFSDAARACLQHDEPITAHDPATGISLTYRPDDATLTLWGGRLGDRIRQVVCTEAELDITARKLLDQLARRRFP